MKDKIFKSICLVGIITLLSSLILIMGVLYEYFTSAQMKQLVNDTSLAAVAVENDGLDYLNKLSDSDYRITWIKEDGTVLFDNKADSQKMENHLERQEVKEAIENGEGTSIRYSDTVLYRSLYSAKLLSDGSIIRLSISQSSWWAIFVSMIQPLMIVVFLAIVLSFFLAYRLSDKIVKPINDINLEDPKQSVVYEEVEPLIDRLYYQQKILKKQEEELQKKRNEFNAVTKNLSEGLILLNEEGVILSINDCAGKLLDINSYAIGKDLLLFNNREELSDLIKSAKEGKHDEKMIEIKGINYAFYVSPIISKDVVNGIALLIFDMSEKEKAEMMRKEFTANVSHELKTPLQNISGCAELLSSGLVKNEDVEKFSKQIYGESKRLMALIEDIIKLSYLDENTSDIVKSDVDLYEVCDNAIINLKEIAHKNNVSLHLSGEGAKLLGVKEMLNMMAYNLIDNAIKYNKENGSVYVEVKDLDDKVSLSVKDTGIGIPLESKDRIFERFYRVDKSRSKEVGGTGLGLSIVKHVVKSHNGQIEVDSVLNEGTTIIVTLPKE